LKEYFKSFSKAALLGFGIGCVLAAIAFPGFHAYKDRAYDSDAKSNLHNVYLACKAYWYDNGSDAVCTSMIAKGTAYGYIQSADVTISGSGTETDFSATAQNTNSKKSFRIDSEGNITEID